MRILIFVLTLTVFSCSGFPVYDYELPVTEEALNASIAKINSRSWGTNLYGVVRSHVTRVDMWNSDAYRLELHFSIRQTVCTKHSGRDPFTCDFKIGPFVSFGKMKDSGKALNRQHKAFQLTQEVVYPVKREPTAFCRSVVEVSGELISNVIVQCHHGTSSSESMSSEEMMHMPILNPRRQGSGRREDAFAPEAFPSRGRGGGRGDWHKPSYFGSGKIE